MDRRVYRAGETPSRFPRSRLSEGASIYNCVNASSSDAGYRGTRVPGRDRSHRPCGFRLERRGAGRGRLRRAGHGHGPDRAAADRALVGLVFRSNSICRLSQDVDRDDVGHADRHPGGIRVRLHRPERHGRLLLRIPGHETGGRLRLRLCRVGHLAAARRGSRDRRARRRRDLCERSLERAGTARSRISSATAGR